MNLGMKMKNVLHCKQNSGVNFLTEKLKMKQHILRLEMMKCLKQGSRSTMVSLLMKKIRQLDFNSRIKDYFYYYYFHRC